MRIIEPHFDHEITWITASREFLLIAHGGPQPKLVIYKLAGPFNVPDRSIDLQWTPTELVIYEDSLCICVQASPDGTHLEFISLNGASNYNPKTRDERIMRNIICGNGFFLFNDANNRICSYELANDEH